MESNDYQPINDAYQLVEGALIKGKTQDEIFKLGTYDPDKHGYVVHPFDDGRVFEDFSVIVTESELMDNYLVEKVNVNAEVPADKDMPLDGV